MAQGGSELLHGVATLGSAGAPASLKLRRAGFQV